VAKGFSDGLALALGSPGETLAYLDKLDCEESFSFFVGQAFQYVDPEIYIHGRHIDAIGEHLMAVFNGQIRKIIINIPPRHMKSLLVSVMFPAWGWGPGNRPGLTFLYNSYAHSLSLRDSRKCRQLIQSRWYQQNWGDRFCLVGDQNEKKRFDNDHGGYRMASSIDGQNTGEGAKILGIDDPHNMKDMRSKTKVQNVIDWWTDTMTTRRNNIATSSIILVMQRGGENDLSGHILANELGWDHLCLPAEYERKHPFPAKSSIGFKDWRRKEGELLWPELFDKAAIDELKDGMTSHTQAGQLQQRPSNKEGGMFQVDRIEVVPEAPDKLQYLTRGWDFAATEEKSADYSAGVKIGFKDGIYYVVHVDRFQKGPGPTENQFIATTENDGYGCRSNIPQDPGQAGKAQVYHLKSLVAGYPVSSSTESGSKELRAEAFAAQVGNGNVKIVRGFWNKLWLDEHKHFPYGKNDDQVDASSRAFNKVAALKRREMKKGGDTPPPKAVGGTIAPAMVTGG
jgi:predicted phage terminase large subunit-like protein